jgi:hypothetical protein
MKKKKVTQMVKTLYVFVSLVFLSLGALAQTPAANISGPLKANVNGSNITVTSQIEYGTKDPILTYTFLNNTAGAYIVSKGKYIYDPVTGEGSQTIVVNPGNSAGSFVINLEVETVKGKGKCSKSVVVSPGNLSNH